MNEFTKTEVSSSTIWEEARQATRQIGDWYVLTATRNMPVAGNVVLARQVHGGNIAMADKNKGIVADGLVIEKEGIVAGVTTADCAPVLVTGNGKAVILHISRKTLVRGLLANASTHIEPAEIEHVYIGPHICPTHFKFEEERPLLRRFRYRYPEAVHFHQGKIHLDIKKAIESQMREWRVHLDKITADGRCTYEDESLSSYRRWLEGGKEGELRQMNTVVWRKVE